MNLFFLKKETSGEKTGVLSKLKITKKFTKKQRIILAIAFVLVIGACAFFTYNAIFAGGKNEKGEITAFAQRSTVSSVIEGSGIIEALQQYDITSLIKGEVVEDYFEEGDTVSKDDILYQMDDESGHDAVDNAISSVSKAQRAYNNALNDVNNLVVKSKTNGVVTQVYIQEGDSVGSNTKVADVIDNSNMVLEIQFLEDYARSMIAGVSSASVTLSKNGTVLYGTVTKISTGSLLSSVGAKVTNVEITVSNPGAIKEGDYATADVNGLSCSSEGKFKNAGKGSIYTEVSGKVEKLHVMPGDNITYGKTVAILSNDKLTDLDETGENLQEAQKKYNSAVEGLEDYVVKAPISGTIIQKNIKAGEKLENNTGSVMAIIADLSSLVFEMSVDELDISKLSVGMDVNVEADAIEGVTFGAKVTGISIVGTSNNGVTSYPVKITINHKDEQSGAAYENYDKLIPGMNVSASVVIQRVENVIVVPVSAVRRGNIVFVSEDSASEGIEFGKPSSNNAFSGGKTSSFSTSDAAKPSQKTFGNENKSDGKNNGNKNPSQSKQDSTDNSSKKAEDRLKAMMDSLDVPSGYKAIIVETGLSDESYIEIKRGLSEGDKVLLPDTTQTTAQTARQGMMGGMGGSMPSGMGAMGGMGGSMPGGMGYNRSGGMNTNRSGSTGSNRSGSTMR